jgi:RNA polymerase sigma factor (TIGR02999 family)
MSFEGFFPVPANTTTSHEITGWLRAWENGDAAALDHLVPHVYRELKRLARRRRRSSAGETLQTTALVHEAYLRLADMSNVRWQDRVHFYAVSARIMRGLRREGLATGIDFDNLPDAGSGHAEDILAIHEALERLARMDPRQAQVVEMRFFGGLSVEEAAEVLKLSPQSVMRDWKLAKAWLRRELRQGDGSPGR